MRSNFHGTVFSYQTGTPGILSRVRKTE